MSLEKHLSPPRAVYLLLHDAAPIRDGALKETVDATLPLVGLAAFNHSTSSAAEGGESALSAARTLPMMADRRLVVVKDLQEGNTPFFEALLSYLEKPNPSTTLVLTGVGYPKVEKGGRRWSTKVDKAVRAAGGFVLDRKQSMDPVAFAMERALAQKKKMDRGAARFLVEVSGASLGTLAQEVDKLVLYVGDDEAIQAKDVEAACARVAEAEVWGLITSLMQRHTRATTQLQQLLSDGQEPRRLLALATWKFRMLLAAADALSVGASDGDARKVSGLRFNEIRDVKAALKAGLAPPHRILGDLAQANLHMNSHRAGANRVLERLVLDWVA